MGGQEKASRWQQAATEERLRGWGAVLRGRHNADGRGGAAAPVPAATPAATCAAPAENYAFHSNAAADKHRYAFPKLVVLGILAGAYIGLGYSLCTLVGGQLSAGLRASEPGLFNLLFGIYGFPMGLTLCVVAGADLFTSNVMYTTIAVAEGRYGLLGAARCLATSYCCNLLGCLLLIGVMLGGEVFHGREGFVIELALRKVSHPFGATLCRGMLCNWLVCLAVWQGNAARDLTGKFVGIFLPNSAFVSMGFEHCIANMYLIPLSMCLGSGISVGTFITKNLIPSTLGNLIGGAVFVGAAYACSFGAPAHAVADMWDAALSTCLPSGRRQLTPSMSSGTLPSANGRHQGAHQDQSSDDSQHAPHGAIAHGSHYAV